MATFNSIPSNASEAALVGRFRETWLRLSEVQNALDQDESRYQDTRNRFVCCLADILDEQSMILEELERRYVLDSGK